MCSIMNSQMTAQRATSFPVKATLKNHSKTRTRSAVGESTTLMRQFFNDFLHVFARTPSCYIHS